MTTRRILTGLSIFAILIWIGCDMTISTNLPQCPTPLPVLDFRDVGTVADTTVIVFGCPYGFVDVKGDTTWVDSWTGKSK